MAKLGQEDIPRRAWAQKWQDRRSQQFGDKTPSSLRGCSEVPEIFRFFTFLFLISFLSCTFSNAQDQEWQQRVGLYVWGQLPVVDEPLIRAAEDAKAVGATGAIRIAISPYWDPKPDAAPNTPLYRKIYRRDYWTVLNSFPVVMITAYDAASYPWKYRNCLSDSSCDPLFRAVRTEFRLLAFGLGKLPGTYIISNWESENDVPEAEKWNVYRAYLQARIDGIREGRNQAKALGYLGNVYSAFEFLILNDFIGKPSALVEIGTRLKGIDFLSYSSWHSIGWDHRADELEWDFEYAVKHIREFARENHISDRLIIGEFGELWDMHPTPERMEALIDGSLAGGAEFLFNWVAYDQPGQIDEHARDVSHFGKFYLDGKLTPQGSGFARLFQRRPCRSVVGNDQKVRGACTSAPLPAELRLAK
jgi:hypothetical protein